MEELTVGTRVEHARYGEGMVSEIGLTNVSIIFKKGGEMEFSKNNEEIEVLELNEEGGTGGGVDLEQVEELITHVLNKYASLSEVVEMGDRWTGGEMSLQPANKEQQPKVLPVETFFHKIVMLRDRLRVLEQNINSHPKLTDEEKVHMQQYITRCYGSLTTFNVLFKNKEDYFSTKGE